MSLASQQPMWQLHQVCLLMSWSSRRHKYCMVVSVWQRWVAVKYNYNYSLNYCIQYLSGNIDILKLLSQKHKKLMTQEAADGKCINVTTKKKTFIIVNFPCRHDSSVLCSPRRTTRSTQVPCHKAEVWFDYCEQWWTETNPCCFTMWSHTHYQGLWHLFSGRYLKLFSFFAVHRISSWQPNSVWYNPRWGYITPLCCMWVYTCWCCCMLL